MGFEHYAVSAPSAIERYYDLFSRNLEARKRYVLTSKTGQHLIGVPEISYPFDRADGSATFKLTTVTNTYKIPFSELAWADELAAAAGVRPSDGMPIFPEPCGGSVSRDKSQKFGILDSPTMLAEDLRAPSGICGLALLYLDIDNFKLLNSKHTERTIDKTVLPEFQRVVADVADRHGFSYAEGGDEVIVLLLNCTEGMGIPFAESLRQRIEEHEFEIGEGRESLTVSIGVAASVERDSIPVLPDWANAAKKHSKDNGKNCTSVKGATGIRRVSSPFEVG